MKCKNCGSENLDNSKFCEMCGSTLDTNSTEDFVDNDLETKKCSKCGATIEPSDFFCQICGEPCRQNNTDFDIEQNEATKIHAKESEQNVGYVAKKQNIGAESAKNSSKKKLIIGIIVGLVACLAIVGGIFFFAGNGSGDVLDEDQLGTVSITSWDWDWDSCREDGSVATVDIIMNVHNGSDSDISGIAFTSVNAKGNIISNESAMYTPDTPFYSEGFVASGSSGIMVCSATVRLNEKKLYKASRNMPKALESEIVEAYLFLGEEGYTVPYGQISSKNDVNGGLYDVEITNNNDIEVKSESSKVVMGYYAGANEIKDADATGVLESDIPPNDTIIEKSAFTDPNLWGSIVENTYWVYVIDNSYGDGKFYFDTYQKNYGKDE